MSQKKSHQDPITYHAYGKVLGIYSPSSEELGKGSFTTEDGITFPATLLEEALAELEKNLDRLNQIGIWRCYFRTRPHSLQLIRGKFDNLECTGKLGVDDFRVVGKVIEVENSTVIVQIKRNKGTVRPFKISLRGTFDYDPSHKFYRFELERKGRKYKIARSKKVGLPLPEQTDEPRQTEVIQEKHKPAIIKFIKK